MESKVQAKVVPGFCFWRQPLASEASGSMAATRQLRRTGDCFEIARGCASPPPVPIFATALGQNHRRAELVAVARDVSTALDPGELALEQVTLESIQAAKAKGQRLRFRQGLVAPVLEVHVYRPGDTLIRNDPSRNWLQGEHAAWVDTTGVLELRQGVNLRIPVLDSGIFLEAGFQQAALLHYRSILPYSLDGTCVRQVLEENPLKPPLSAERAREMSLGAQFGLRGVGQITGHVGLTGGPLSRFAGMTVGAAAIVEGIGRVRGELELDVLRLADDKVRMTLRRVAANSQSMTAELRAGLMVRWSDVPLCGLGLLLRCLELGAGPLLALVRKYGSVRALIGRYQEHDDTETTVFTFDLSSPAAAAAYDAAMGLHFGDAENLALLAQTGEDSGVVAKESLLSTDSDAAKRYVRVFGTKLLLSETLLSETHGVVRDGTGQELLVRKSLRHRECGNLVSGSQTIDWLMVQARRRDGRYEPYLQLRYRHHNRLTLPEQVEGFFRLAEALGDARAAGQRPKAAAALRDLAKVPWAKRALTRKDDTKMHVDVYFNASGLARIAAAGASEVVGAYVGAQAKLLPTLAGHPLAQDPSPEVPTFVYDWLAEWVALQGAWWWTRAQRRRAGELSSQYSARFSRDLRLDAQTFSEGLACWRRLTRLGGQPDEATPVAADLEERRAQTTSALFMEMGERLAFRFEPLAAMLARLAGENGTLVHEFTLSGAGLHVKGSAEPAPVDPTVLLRRRLLALLQPLTPAGI